MPRVSLCEAADGSSIALSSGASDARLLGRSDAIQELRHQIATYGAYDATVLVAGETGAGKDLVARALHAASSRANGPLVTVNCAAIPDGLLEAEFFGSVRGAFTGALQNRRGLVEAADGGVLFLDEVGDLALPLQAKLLRLLESGSYRPVGETRDREADLRIVAATHHDLFELIERGRFREDLYYRLDVLRIDVPPLRERLVDLPVLVEAFVRRFATPGPIPEVAPAAIGELAQHAWPGNVRELKHVVQRAVVRAQGRRIERFDPPRRRPGTTSGGAGDMCPSCESGQHSPRSRVSRESLVDLLARHRGCVGAVADALDVSTRTVQRRMKSMGLESRDFRRRRQRG